MHVWSILGQKGGSGKTTTALGLGVAASLRKRSVAIVDLDPQATAANWADRRASETPAVVSCQVSRLTQVLQAADERGADLAIIDCPGKSTDALISAAKAADLCLIPIQPQLYDIETLGSIQDILTLAGNPLAAVFVNRAPIQGSRHSETQEAARAKGFRVSPIVLYARAAHGDSGNLGSTAQEYLPDCKAAREMLALYTYSYTTIKEKRK
ncbi:MAG TPA: ParA family protein [Nitrososphaerales archaeon]|nr:ParA family protein [Nitrososphaerales archaeon]